MVRMIDRDCEDSYSFSGCIPLVPSGARREAVPPVVRPLLFPLGASREVNSDEEFEAPAGGKWDRGLVLRSDLKV